MMDGAGCVDDGGQDGGLDLEERGQQQGVHHSGLAGFILMPKDGCSEAKMAGNFECPTRDVRVTGARFVFAFIVWPIRHKEPFKFSIALPAFYSLLLLIPNTPSAISAAFSLATIPNSSKISSVCSPVRRGDGGRPEGSAIFHG